MPETCRAAVFLGDGHYELRELRLPSPPSGGAVLQVEAVGLCGSDLAQLHGVELVPGASVFPVVPGHETVGRIVALAPDAELGVAEGDRVAVDEVLSMGPPLQVYGYSDMTGAGEVGLWGGYGEYMEIFAGTHLHVLPGDRPAAELTVFEPLANAVNWVSVAGVEAGDTVVIQGPGHQGLAVLEAVLARKPSTVVVTGTSADGLRLATAKAIGATATVMVDVDDPVTVVKDLTHGMGADKVFDVATAVQTVPMAFELVTFRGTVLLAGLKHFAEIPGFVSDKIVVAGLKVFGGSGFTPTSMTEAVELLRSGKVDTGAMAGEVFDIEHLDDAMALLGRSDPSRDAVRVSLAHTTNQPG
jgi:threonine dehydrogenase-like Zn-dependent dehydrogenase